MPLRSGRPSLSKGAKDSRWWVMPMAAMRLRSVGESLESTSPMVARLVSHQRIGLCSYWSIAGVCSWMFCFAVCQMFPSASTTIAFVDVVEESIATTRGPSARYLFSVMMLLPHL